jgi:hypothetical protein
MGNEGRPIRFGDPIPGGQPGGKPDVADLLDPVALEERLKEARARRAAALAGRKPVAAPPPHPHFAEAAAAFHLAATTAEAPAPAVEALEAAPAPTTVSTAAVLTPAETPAEAPVATPRRWTAAVPFERVVRVPIWAIFVTGLALGAAIVALVALAPATRAPGSAPAASPAPVASAEAPAPEAAPEVAEAAPHPLPAALPAGGAPATPAEPTPPAADVAVVPERAAAAEAPPPVAPPVEPARPALEAAPPSGLASPAREPAPAPALETARVAPPAVPTPAEPAPAAPGPLPARVIVHYPPSAAAEAERARAALAAAGVATVGTIPVRLDISRSNVRFYHAADRDAAATVSALLGAGGEPPLARDFTDYATPAAPGALEVWLAGDSARAATLATRPRPTVAAGEPRMPVAGTFVRDGATPPPAAPADQAEAVARIIVERAYERLMNALPAN